MQHSKPFVIVITGPTASGKTELAMRLKDKLPIQLINMDSAQVYREMNIGTAKISQQEQQEYPHHLMDIISPEQSYSVAEFVHDTQALVHQITQNKEIPLLVGGTALYFNALLNGLSKLPGQDQAIRQSLQSIIDTQGTQALHNELTLIDSELAKTVTINDRQRLVRFLEIAKLTKQPPSQLFKEAEKHKVDAQFFHIKFFPNDRDWLHQRIAKRFDIMLEQGFIEEVTQLNRTYHLHTDLPSMKCAGYKQVLQYLNGGFDNLTPLKTNKTTNTAYQEMKDRSIFATRQLAKRQITWLRKFNADITIDPSESMPYQIENIIHLIQQKLN